MAYVPGNLAQQLQVGVLQAVELVEVAARLAELHVGRVSVGLPHLTLYPRSRL